MEDKWVRTYEGKLVLSLLVLLAVLISTRVALYIQTKTPGNNTGVVTAAYDSTLSPNALTAQEIQPLALQPMPPPASSPPKAAATPTVNSPSTTAAAGDQKNKATATPKQSTTNNSMNSLTHKR